jgi:hypothetical protein
MTKIDPYLAVMDTTQLRERIAFCERHAAVRRRPN